MKPKLTKFYPCKVSSSQFSNTLPSGGEFLQEVMGLLKRKFLTYNCTFVYAPRGTQLKLGSLVNGTYDGAIGELVREECNSTMVAYAIGSVDGEPFKVGSVYSSTELSILSLKNDDREKSIGLEGWVTGFDTMAFFYTLLSVIVFATWFIIARVFYVYGVDAENMASWNRKLTPEMEDRLAFRQVKESIWRGVRMFPLTLWDGFISLIDQQVVPIGEGIPSKLLIASFSVGVFNLVFGYFLNQVSVDMVALEPVEKIETLSELMDNPTFAHVQAGCMGGLYQEAALRGSMVGSLPYRLAQRITKDNLWLAFKAKINLNEVMAIVKPFLERKRVAVIGRSIIPTVKSFLCQGIPDIDSDNFYMSKDWFGERLLSIMISRGSQDEFVQHIRYRQTRLHESKIFQHATYHAYRYIKLEPSYSDFAVLQCINGKGDGTSQDLPLPFEASFYYPLFFICSFMIMLALILLVSEKVLHRKHYHQGFKERKKGKNSLHA